MHFRGTSYQALTTDSTSFNNVDIATKEAALAETRRVGGDYCLQLVLGEFRDAAPMTFRSDFVTLSQGVMWAAATGAEVWNVREPVTSSKGNIGGHTGMVESFGAQVVKSITH